MDDAVNSVRAGAWGSPDDPLSTGNDGGGFDARYFCIMTFFHWFVAVGGAQARARDMCGLRRGDCGHRYPPSGLELRNVDARPLKSIAATLDGLHPGSCVEPSLEKETVGAISRGHTSGPRHFRRAFTLLCGYSLRDTCKTGRPTHGPKK